jgi:hypothetical protein
MNVKRKTKPISLFFTETRVACKTKTLKLIIKGIEACLSLKY